MARMPRLVRVQTLTNQALIADECVVAERFLERFRGLIGKRKLLQGEAMWFPRCNSIHMWFMSFPIDVVFLRALGTGGSPVRYVVTSVRENVRAWKPLPLWDAKATETLELPVGSLKRFLISAGEEVCIN